MKYSPAHRPDSFASLSICLYFFFTTLERIFNFHKSGTRTRQRQGQKPGEWLTFGTQKGAQMYASLIFIATAILHAKCLARRLTL